MTVNLGFLKFTLGFDSIQFRKGMTEAERDLVKLQKKFEGVGDKLTQLGKTLTLGVTAPLAALSLKSFEVATDVQEMQSAFDVSFGAMAGNVRQWAEETGKQLGRSQITLQKSAMAFQELFGKALDPAKSAAMSKSFAVLTQDLASFKNLSNEVAQQKLLSGLAGEAEPLRSVGVFLSAAKVEAKALEMGLMGVNNELTEEEKIMARAAVIQQELVKANGDLLRTKNSTANQIKAAKDAFLDLQVVIGEKLLPALTPFITKLAEALTWFTQLPQPIQDMALAGIALSAALGPLMGILGGFVGLLAKSGPLVLALNTAFGALLPWVKALGPAIGILSKAMIGLFANPFVLGAAALIGGIYLAWKNWDKITAIVQRVYQGVKTWLVDKLGAVIEAVKKKVNAIGDAFQWLGDRLVFNSIVPDMVSAIGVEFGRLGTLMVRPSLTATGEVADEFERLQTQAESRTAAIIDSFGQMASGVVGSLKDMVASFKSGDILSGLQSILDLVLNVVTALGQAGLIKVGGGTSETGALPAKPRAMGGPVVPGKTYLVGERGPEFITPRRSGYVHPNGTALGQAVKIQVVPGAYFDVVVDGRVQRVAAPMAAQAAVGGAIGAQQSLARRRRHSLG